MSKNVEIFNFEQLPKHIFKSISKLEGVRLGHSGSQPFKCKNGTAEVAPAMHALMNDDDDNLVLYIYKVF